MGWKSTRDGLDCYPKCTVFYAKAFKLISNQLQCPTKSLHTLVGSWNLAISISKRNGFSHGGFSQNNSTSIGWNDRNGIYKKDTNDEKSSSLQGEEHLRLISNLAHDRNHGSWAKKNDRKEKRSVIGTLLHPLSAMHEKAAWPAISASRYLSP